MKSIFFLTSQTSATTSIARIITTVLNRSMEYVRFYDKALETHAKDEVSSLVPPKDGKFLLFNHPPSLNRDMPLTDYKYMINFRDPRDRICNSYFWQFSHPTKETEEQRAKRIQRVKKMGIDRWVLDRIAQSTENDYYKNIFWLIENAPQGSYVVATYAQLCCDFDSFIKKVIEITGVTPSPNAWKLLEDERPETVENNAKWIGNEWVGSDVVPGRYKQELKPETIEAVSDYFKDTLKKMANADPEFAHQYLENVKS
ncbi:hypothetical protein ACFQFQ_11900 [Sulfitobacter porphyrae]|uniref:Sulfotransferase domain-containing protein n=1 Tax=Sulfitobacter porphyrae TaxID=1246864 RepID=A0ABW2B481_9RHOB|nr:hypothetical protein GCM10007928_21860 [Sulfitobacter porphyrae]